MFSWLNFLLAISQSSITHLAAGPGIVKANFDQLAEPLDLPSLCHNQRMVAPDGYSNISVLGLALIITLSTAIIATDLTLIPTLKSIHRCNHKRFPCIKFWSEDGMLQVLRKAYEGIGYSNWASTDSDIPSINNNTLIPTLSVATIRNDIEAVVTRTVTVRQPRNIKGTADHLQYRVSTRQSPLSTSSRGSMMGPPYSRLSCHEGRPASSPARNSSVPSLVISPEPGQKLLTTRATYPGVTVVVN
jgi:hypothetical protein